MMLLFAISASGFGTCLLAYIAWIWWGLRRPFNAARTPDDVYRDVDIHRACRRFAQAIDDHDTCWRIWPDADRAARIAETQHRLDKHRKDNEQ
ncbi:hypothetical protein [Streptomyces sp. NPDC059165]|uniref:hypothetical protein n=1 Tax=Streptomyces sp. NPDC059165 TaxID=3346751 RepID=UPI0036A7583E